MSPPLGSQIAYSQFVYDLLTDRTTIETHTVSLYTIGQTVGILRGEVKFRSGHRLRVFEQIDFLQQRILKYSYMISNCGGMTLCPIPIFPSYKALIRITNMYRLI